MYPCQTNEGELGDLCVEDILGLDQHGRQRFPVGLERCFALRHRWVYSWGGHGTDGSLIFAVRSLDLRNAGCATLKGFPDHRASRRIRL